MKLLLRTFLNTPFLHFVDFFTFRNKWVFEPGTGAEFLAKSVQRSRTQLLDGVARWRCYHPVASAPLGRNSRKPCEEWAAIAGSTRSENSEIAFGKTIRETAGATASTSSGNIEHKISECFPELVAKKVYLCPNGLPALDVRMILSCFTFLSQAVQPRGVGIEFEAVALLASSPMRFLEEIFLESDFDSRQSARQERDQRLAQLQAQGYECRAENLYTVHTGMQVLVVVALPPAAVSDALRPNEPAGLIVGDPAQGERPRPKMQPKSRSPQSEKLKYSDRSRSRTDPHPG